MSRTEFQGKNFVVTGAAGGIGSAVARTLRARGANLLLSDRANVDLEELPDGIGRAISYPIDLSQPELFQGLKDVVSSEFGHLDGLINVGAVILRRGSIGEVSVEDFDFQYAVNLRAPFFLMQTLDPLFADDASVVLFSSQGWWTGGFGGSTPYAATKAGVVALVRGLSRMYADRGIRVNAVAPGFVDTRMMREGLTDDALSALVAQVPLGRMAQPDEVAAAAVTFLQDATAYMTGTVMNVSGGQLVY